MVDRAHASATVYEALESLWPGRFDDQALSDDASLGNDGLGLDSIEIVELLLECEERLGNGSWVDEVLETGPVRIGSLIEHLAQR